MTLRHPAPKRRKSVTKGSKEISNGLDTQSKIYQRFGVQRDHITSLHPNPTRHNRKEKVSCHREITFDMSQAGMGEAITQCPSDLFACVICNSTHNKRLLGPSGGVTPLECSWEQSFRGPELWYLPLAKDKEEEKVPTTLRWPALSKRRWKGEGFKVYNLGQWASLFLNLRTCHLWLLWGSSS